MKIAINKCFGGFGISGDAVRFIADRRGLTLYPETDYLRFTTYWTVPKEQREPVLEGKEWHTATDAQRRASNEFYTEHTLSTHNIPRDNADLIAAIEQLGEKANGSHAKLKVVEIPDGVDWTIEDYDGLEHIAEAHRTWE